MNLSLTKLARFVGLLSSFTVSSAIYSLWCQGVGLSIRERQRRQALRLSHAAQLALDILQVRLQSLPSLLPNEGARAGLVVSNHLSTVDVLVLAAIHPSLFVTSMEVKQQWGLGWICRSAGCLFVNRRNKSQIQHEIREIQNALMLGTSVVVFPEGTSTDGSSVLPFKASLFQAAIQAEVPIHLYSVRYSHPGLAYYGSMSFWAHLQELCTDRVVYAQVQYLGTESTQEIQTDRFQLASRSHKMIHDALLSY